MSKWKQCRIEGCYRPAAGKGLCAAHLGRLRRLGTTASHVSIKARK